MGNQERERRRVEIEREKKEEEYLFKNRMEELKNEEKKLEIEFRASLINEDAYKIKKNDILKRAHNLRMENNTFIPEEIDEEIKFWESIKSCNYSQKSILFNKIINADDILIQLYKAKQDKKEVKLKTFDFSIYKILITLCSFLMVKIQKINNESSFILDMISFRKDSKVKLYIFKHII